MARDGAERELVIARVNLADQWQPSGVATRESTALPMGCELRELQRSDAPALHALKVDNRASLTRFGDWTISDDYSVEDVEREFDDDEYPKRSFGLWEGDRLCGVVSLTAVTPTSWSIGYFLDAASTGRGLATSACRAVLPLAANAGAREVYGVVTAGNDESNAVLRRTGFTQLQTTRRSTRWWMPLCADPAPPSMQVYAPRRGTWRDGGGDAHRVDVVEVGFRHIVVDGLLHAVLDPTSSTVHSTRSLFYGRSGSVGSPLTPFPVLEPGQPDAESAQVVVEAHVPAAIEWEAPQAR